MLNPNTLEARLINFTFHLPPSPPFSSNTITKSKLVPKGFDVYTLKSIVGRMFELKPMKLKLTWETGEWDPVGGYEDDDDDESEDDENHDKGIGENRSRGNWVKREVELVDGTRELGFWIDGMDAKVRVEVR
jgi:hypothetical protein